MIIIFLLQLFTSYPDSKDILNGNWQSCRQSDGSYGERVYDHVVNRTILWSFHLGPENDFALFKGDEGEVDDHSSDLNLIKTTEQCPSTWTIPCKREWIVKSLHLRVKAVQAGGSREDCVSWFVTVSNLTP